LWAEEGKKGRARGYFPQGIWPPNLKGIREFWGEGTLGRFGVGRPGLGKVKGNQELRNLRGVKGRPFVGLGRGVGVGVGLVMLWFP